jgi:Cu-Zn family superoxide dismutase
VMNPKGPHAGDMPNLHVPESGTLQIEVLNATVALSESSLLDVDGSAIVIHAGPDDYKADPAGNAGDRIACGAITP